MAVRFMFDMRKQEKSDGTFPSTLFKAIKEGNEDTVADLLRGRDINLDRLTDATGETPLSLAARLRSAAVAAAMCEKLIGLGASPGAPTGEHGRTPLIMMVRYRGAYYSKVAALLATSVNAADD